MTQWPSWRASSGACCWRTAKPSSTSTSCCPTRSSLFRCWTWCLSHSHGGCRTNIQQVTSDCQRAAAQSLPDGVSCKLTEIQQTYDGRGTSLWVPATNISSPTCCFLCCVETTSFPLQIAAGAGGGGGLLLWRHSACARFHQPARPHDGPAADGAVLLAGRPRCVPAAALARSLPWSMHASEPWNAQ